MYVAYYTVRPGDTLAMIAARFGMTVEELARDNGIRDISRLFPGQRIRIHSETPLRYIVRREDSLPMIADRFGTTIDNLMRINNLGDPNQIYPGQLLWLK